MTEALVIIDLQRWFFRTEARAAKLTTLVPRVNALARAADDARQPIVVVRTSFTADRSAWSLRMRQSNIGVLIDGTSDVEDVDGLLLPNPAISVLKTRHSAFVRTKLETVLRGGGVTSLLLAGAFVDGCIGLTAIDGYERDFPVRIAADAVVSVDDTQGKAILQFLKAEFDIPAVPTAALLDGLHRTVSRN
jgi:nicotinamidase-related amidase